MNKAELLRPRLPHLLLDVVGSDESGELLLIDGEHFIRATLRGRVWELFKVLLQAQLDSSDERPHQGFKKAKDLRRQLSDRPDVVEIVRRVNRLRTKLAEARFGDGRPGDPTVDAFRQAIIETTSFGYRLSIPPNRISYSRALGGGDDDQDETTFPRFA